MLRRLATKTSGSGYRNGKKRLPKVHYTLSVKQKIALAYCNRFDGHDKLKSCMKFCDDLLAVEAATSAVTKKMAERITDGN